MELRQAEVGLDRPCRRGSHCCAQSRQRRRWSGTRLFGDFLLDVMKVFARRMGSVREAPLAAVEAAAVQAATQTCPALPAPST